MDTGVLCWQRYALFLYRIITHASKNKKQKKPQQTNTLQLERPLFQHTCASFQRAFAKSLGQFFHFFKHLTIIPTLVEI